MNDFEQTSDPMVARAMLRFWRRMVETGQGGEEYVAFYEALVEVLERQDRARENLLRHILEDADEEEMDN